MWRWNVNPATRLQDPLYFATAELSIDKSSTSKSVPTGLRLCFSSDTVSELFEGKVFSKPHGRSLVDPVLSGRCPARCPGGRPAFELLVEFRAHTSASNRDKISIPLFSALCFRSSSKGSMRMIIFRPGVRPFSTFSISIDAFLGVSQITVAISAESRNRAGGHRLALLCP